MHSVLNTKILAMIALKKIVKSKLQLKLVMVLHLFVMDRKLKLRLIMYRELLYLMVVVM